LISKPDGGERKQCSNYGDDVTVEEAKRMGGRPCKKCHPPE
jgi:methylphosphotriester-DNA--protein-cysteine methyltransferase